MQAWETGKRKSTHKGVKCGLNKRANTLTQSRHVVLFYFKYNMDCAAERQRIKLKFFDYAGSAKTRSATKI